MVELVTSVKEKILFLRGKQVMLDRDLAEFYMVQTKRLNEAVKRNKDRFPRQFMFQLTKDEFENLMSQNATSSLNHGGVRKLPYVFTEQGVAMLAGILRSDKAVKVSIEIINAFVLMRNIVRNNSLVDMRLNNLEKKQLIYDSKLEEIYSLMDKGGMKEGIFFDGQVFDALLSTKFRMKKSIDFEMTEL